MFSWTPSLNAGKFNGVRQPSAQVSCPNHARCRVVVWLIGAFTLFPSVVALSDAARYDLAQLEAFS